MTQIQQDCQDGILKVIQAMELALKEASGENAPPLPSAGKRSITVGGNASSSVPYSSSSSMMMLMTENNTVAAADTTIQKREKWETDMRNRLAPLAMNVKDACADLHESLELLSEFALDEGRCEHAKNDMLVKTAQMEERIVQVYSMAAKKEKELVEELENMAGGGD